MITNANYQQLYKALDAVNDLYDDNISFKDIRQLSKNRVRFTLKAKSKLKGSRTSWTGKNLPCASCHVHGHLFDQLFLIDNKIFVKSLGKCITYGKNWSDYNVGSIMNPINISQLSIE